MKLNQLLVPALLAATTAHAEAPKSPWSGDAELGYVSTSGNTDNTSVKTRADVKHTQGKWGNQTHFDALNTKEDANRSAEKYFLSNKTTYSYSDKNYSFVYVAYEDDRFSGFDWQATAALGYGRQLLKTDTMEWNAEVGPGYRVSNLKTPGAENEKEAILRANTKFSWTLSESAVFEEEFSVETGSDNTISKSVTSLKSKVAGPVAMRLSYTIKYTEEVPTGTKHADTETAITLVYSF